MFEDTGNAEQNDLYLMVDSDVESESGVKSEDKKMVSTTNKSSKRRKRKRKKKKKGL